MRRWILWALGCLCCWAVQAFAAPALAVPADALAQHVLATGDAQGRPFAIVDKAAARLHVYTAGGRLAGTAPALVGLTAGDHALPGTGRLRHIPPAARTTPAGRYESEPGINLAGEAIVWFDYDAGLAIHRLRPAPAAERRPARLASATPADNRITLGCVVVDGAFYDRVVAPLLGRARGMVYVMRESAAASPAASL